MGRGDGGLRPPPLASWKNIFGAFLAARRYAEHPLVLLRKTAGVRITSTSLRKKNDQMVILFSWRRRGDSNSRSRSPQTNDLANRPLQPLGYSSMRYELRVSRSSCLITNLGDGFRLLICASCSSHLDAPPWVPHRQST